ncbi:MAG: exodeoxyribonuclease I [Gammaproteobacteria bacterium]|nr:MAG: exodeoxyribonuclease I [Gammaproteobacteria bacterium]
MTDSYFWHDYETFGANPRIDRPAQFAGIRTTLDFEPVEDPVVLYCRPAPDMLPHPEACLITGITPQVAEQQGVIESEFFGAIEAQFTRPGTCIVGYNNIRFDDEVTRFGFFRNFIDPYAWHWQNGNSRWDIIDLVRLTYALRPDGIEWPERPGEPGVPSFRLEDLAAANGLLHEQAHDALSDVHATIALARLIREKQPRLFSWVWNNRDRQWVLDQLDPENPQPLLHASSRFPSRHGGTSMVVPIMRDPNNRNATWVYDLRQNPEAFLGLGPEELLERLYGSREQLEAEGKERLPVKQVHANRAPVLAPVNTLDSASETRIGLDKTRAMAHFEFLQRHPELVLALREALQQQREWPGEDDPEPTLYSGPFFSDNDKREIARVRRSTPEQLAQETFVFEDRRLDELLLRYRARNWPETLNEAERAQWEEWRHHRLNDPRYGITLEEYGERLFRLEQEHPEAAPILEQLEEWGMRVSG